MQYFFKNSWLVCSQSISTSLTAAKDSDSPLPPAAPFCGESCFPTKMKNGQKPQQSDVKAA
jgi:hypothetical protein